MTAASGGKTDFKEVFGFLGIAAFGRHDKLIFSVLESVEHVTLQLGLASGILDVHRTNERTGEHETLYAARFTDMSKLASTLQVEDLAPLFLKAYRPLTWEWLRETDKYLCRLHAPAHVLRELLRKKRPQDDLPDGLVEIMDIGPAGDFEDEFATDPAGTYVVYQRLKRTWRAVGSIQAIESSTGHWEWVRVKYRQFRKLQKILEERLLPQFMALDGPEVRSELADYLRNGAKPLGVGNLNR